MLPGFWLDWMDAFLSRPPEQVLASYLLRHCEVTLENIGFVRQVKIFDRIAQREGAAPPVLGNAAVLADLRAASGALCEILPAALKPIAKAAGPYHKAMARHWLVVPNPGRALQAAAS